MARPDIRPGRLVTFTAALVLAGGCGGPEAGRSTGPTSAEAAAPTTGIIVGPTVPRERQGPVVPTLPQTAQRAVDATCVKQDQRLQTRPTFEEYICPPGMLVQVDRDPTQPPTNRSELAGGLVITTTPVGGEQKTVDFTREQLRFGTDPDGSLLVNATNMLPGCKLVFDGNNPDNGTPPTINSVNLDCD